VYEAVEADAPAASDRDRGDGAGTREDVDGRAAGTESRGGFDGSEREVRGDWPCVERGVLSVMAVLLVSWLTYTWGSADQRADTRKQIPTDTNADGGGVKLEAGCGNLNWAGSIFDTGSVAVRACSGSRRGEGRSRSAGGRPEGLTLTAPPGVGAITMDEDPWLGVLVAPGVVLEFRSGLTYVLIVGRRRFSLGSI
jgi:hypothetical protein